MPFIDLNALNPLKKKDDATASDQSQTAQAVDPNAQLDPSTQVQTDLDPSQAATAPSAAPADMPASAAQQDSAMTTVADATNAVAATMPSVDPMSATSDASVTDADITDVAQQLEQNTPVTEQASADGAEMAQNGGQVQQQIEVVATDPVDTNSISTPDAPVQEGMVDLKASSSSEEQNMDKAGNPIPQIQVAPGGEVQMDESGMREVKGPGFEPVPGPSATQQLESQNLDAKLQVMSQPEEAGNPVPVDMQTPAPTPMMAPADSQQEMTTQTDNAEVVAQDSSTMEANIDQSAVMPMTNESTQTIDVPSTPSPVSDPVVPQQNLPPIEPSPAQPTVTEAVTTAEAEVTAPNQELPQLSDAVKTYSLEELLTTAVQKGASDLHLTAGYRAIIRIDGKLEQIQSQMLDDAAIKGLVQPVLADVKLENPEDIRDLDLAYQAADGTRFRVNIYKQQGSQAAVFRLIPSQIRSIEDLNLPSKLKEFTQMSQGLVLVTGPTGSGKSTTLAAMINEINMKDSRHIVTIEDPIEFVYPKGKALVDQRNVKQDTDNWGDALRSVLRQDPDVVLIGEMRDLETISAALHIAETGHLVFGTLHTNSAAQSIDRIIDVFPKEQQAQVQTQLASVIKAVVSQRLVPARGGGRKVAVEIMVATPAVSNSIRSSKVYQIDNIIQTSADLGMITMEKSLAGLVKSGAISLEQAQFFANKPDEVAALVK